MAKLILTLGGDFLAEFPLDKERLVIGRRPSCDIRLENLAISGEHADVIVRDGEVYLEDNQSTNGTRVNGEVVTRHKLVDGDIIGLGRHQLEFREENLANERGFEKTIMVMPNAFVTGMPDRGHKRNAVPSPEVETQLARGRIKVLSGSSSGRELVLQKTLTTLGKTGVQVAVITKRPHGYFLAHVEGDGRPLVNGTAIGVQAQKLADGDEVELAGVRMQFSLEAAAEV
ncbi:FHA domain-containing protein [Methylobacillus glycogenes]|uniref:FHA domain-containing protein n=1 Tax=Methylobacillus glycogenes TaxID=406 RepID=UPI00046FA0C2|nr:FHA domain-containing protein [Methylobacillus glycogenes]